MRYRHKNSTCCLAVWFISQLWLLTCSTYMRAFCSCLHINDPLLLRNLVDSSRSKLNANNESFSLLSQAIGSENVSKNVDKVRHSIIKPLATRTQMLTSLAWTEDIERKTWILLLKSTAHAQNSRCVRHVAVQC